MTENTIAILHSIIAMYEFTLCTAVMVFQYAK